MKLKKYLVCLLARRKYSVVKSSSPPNFARLLFFRICVRKDFVVPRDALSVSDKILTWASYRILIRCPILWSTRRTKIKKTYTRHDVIVGTMLANLYLQRAASVHRRCWELTFEVISLQRQTHNVHKHQNTRIIK